MNGRIRALLRRRMLVIPVLVLSVVMVLAMVITVAIAVFTAPAAAPVAVAGTVLGSAADIFGEGEGEGALSGSQLAAAAHEGDVTCDLAPAADPPTSAEEPATSSSPTATEEAESTESSDTPPERPQPIPLGTGGSISREDASTLLAPLQPGISTLQAHVWFLYRLSGLGDWERFTSEYAAAGLRVDEDSPNAPLRQIQSLNTTVSDMERYRLAAAALAAAGEQTGRFSDPYPRYREMVAIELMSSCMAGTGTEGERMELPPAGSATPRHTS